MGKRQMCAGSLLLIGHCLSVMYITCILFVCHRNESGNGSAVSSLPTSPAGHRKHTARSPGPGQLEISSESTFV